MRRIGREAPAPRVRQVHLGLGAFHRAHQAWYVDADPEWGIAAYGGRSAQTSAALMRQQGIYTVVERGRQDRHWTVRSIARAHAAADRDALRSDLADPEVAVVTLTLTEAGYRLRTDGTVDESDEAMAHDIAAAGTPVTPLGRLLEGLAARRRAGGHPVAIVPCDNLPANGTWLRAGVLDLAQRRDPRLADWIRGSVSFVSTSVDRITPRPTPAQIEQHSAATGVRDDCVVFTEPHSEWIMQGDFPLGRPRWEARGARHVADLSPFEFRKLRLLNAAHSILAYSGLLAGHRTVREAVLDDRCRTAVERYWAEARDQVLSSGERVDAYLELLLERFANPGIDHDLAQIATEGFRKLRARVVPVAVLRVGAGAPAPGCADAIGIWIAARSRVHLADTHDAQLRNAAADPVRVLRLLSPELVDDPPFRADVAKAAREATTRYQPRRAS